LTIGALAPAIAWFYGDPRLKMITIGLAALFFIGGLTVQHRALMKRQMRFVTLQSIQVIASLTGVGTGIAFALMGAGYWALVAMPAAASLAEGVGVCIACGWRPGRPDRLSEVKNMLVFGGNITAFNAVNYFSRNLDNILIGRFWGAGPLGLYNKAYGMLMMPLKQINMPLQSVVIPALSRLHGDHPRYRAYYLKAISLITFASTPMIGWFIVCSDELILLMLGAQWLPASEIFAVLGISALIQPLYFTQGWLHISAGRSDRYLRWGLVGSCIIVVGFLVGLPHGPLGVAAAYSVVTWAIVAPGMWYAGNSAGIAGRDIFRAVYKNILAGIAGIACTFFLLEHVFLPTGAWTHLLAGLAVIAVSYNMTILALYRNLNPWREIIQVFVSFSYLSKSADNQTKPQEVKS
jgi:PST family polysaccharide transporter